MNPLAVIDVETTGLNPYRHDRVVEVAVVLLSPGEGIQAELTTLVNPERDVGPTSIHGLTASDVLNAPRFAEIAGNLTEFFRDSLALAGHNVRFDVSFLESEYKRIGIQMPAYNLFDTMRLTGGGTLSACCAENGIQFDGCAHSALHDARAAAHLLQKMLLRHPHYLDQCAAYLRPVWSAFPAPCAHLVPRGEARSATVVANSYISRLAERLSRQSVDSVTPQGEAEYRGLLWRVLEDGRIEECEGEALLEVALNWGLTFERVNAIHLDYLTRLARSAWADRHLTDAEQREILLAAQLLGFGPLTSERLGDLLRACDSDSTIEPPPTQAESWIGKTVCFTGECSCSIHGQLISRELAEQMAVSKGLRVLAGVTKKLDMLVLADPSTQSGKAKKARQYGIRIVHEPTFWRSLGVMVD